MLSNEPLPYLKGEMLMSSINKKELMSKMQEVGQKIGSNAVRDYLDSYDIEINGMELGFYVKDNSKVKWKSNSHFIKLFEMELLRLMTKRIIDIEMLGFLTTLSLYLNYEDNSLINKDGSYINQKDIINITNWSKSKVNKFIKLAIENELLFEQKQEEDKRKSKYFLNPKLFYKGSKIERETKEQFGK
jgi:DNA-binding MarR family transcriptional regulator